MKLHQCPRTADEKNRMVAQAAYYRYEKRGVTGGDPVDDWLAAEAEFEKYLKDFCQPQPQKQGFGAYQRMRSEIQKILATPKSFKDWVNRQRGKDE